MNRDDALARLRLHEPELRRAGVAGLSLFGSVARGEATDGSDVDVVVAVSADADAQGLSYFGLIERLRTRLADILGRPVDIVGEPVRRPALRAAIERDRAVAF